MATSAGMGMELTYFILQVSPESDEILELSQKDKNDLERIKRFYMSDELRSFSNFGALAVKTMGEWLPLKKRYEQFKRTKGKEIILKEIKNNLI